MADFYVDLVRGDDANSGTAASPVRSITQAIILAGDSSDETGTIFIAAGTYEPPNENFPLLMRPGYALQGAGRDRTLIRFTGEARTVSGTATLYWSGTAIQVGSALRDLSLRANPEPSGYSCGGMLGISAIIDGAVIDNVDILGPQLPEEYPERIPSEEVELGFLAAVLIEGADVTYRNSRVRHGGIVLALRGGAPLLDNITLENEGMGLSSDARVQNCEFVFRLLWRGYSLAGPLVTVHDANPTIGPGNFFGWGARPIIDCYSDAIATIIDNSFAAYHAYAIYIRDGASARVSGNYIGVLFGGSIVDVQSDAAPNSLFENNIFFGGPWNIYVRAPSDFGGGPAGSVGNNHFGPVSGRSAEWPGLNWEIPGGGDMYAMDNFWRNGRPDDQIWLGADTRAITTRARVDPTTHEDGLRQFYDLVRSHST